MKTVGENRREMKELAIQAMRENYAAADRAAKEGLLKEASALLEAAEKWRVRARSHGATV